MDSIVLPVDLDEAKHLYPGKELPGAWEYDTAKFAKVEYHPNGKTKIKTYLDENLKPVSDDTGTLALKSYYDDGGNRQLVYSLDEEYVKAYFAAGRTLPLDEFLEYHPSGELKFIEYWSNADEDGKIRRVLEEFREDGTRKSRESFNLAGRPDDSPEYYAQEAFDEKGGCLEAFSFKDGVRQAVWPYKIF